MGARIRNSWPRLKFGAAPERISLRDGIPLLIRTLASRAALYVTTWVRARSGAITMASYQVTMTMWNLLLMAMDALGIAGQALTGASLGAGDVRRTRSLTATVTRWGLVTGVVIIVLAAQSGGCPVHQRPPPYTERSCWFACRGSSADRCWPGFSSSMGCSWGWRQPMVVEVLKLSCSWCIYRWPGLCTSWRRQTRPLQ